MTATILPFAWKPKTPAVCAFCGMPENQAKRMFQGVDGKSICDKCVKQCAQRVAESEKGGA